MSKNDRTISHPGAWTFTLALAKALIPVVLAGVSAVMCKRLGMGNGEAAAVTALLLLPFMLRAYYKPLLCRVSNLRWWVVLLELLFAAAMMGVASGVQAKSWAWTSWLWLLVAAFVGAMHSMAADEYFYTLYGRRDKKHALTWGACAYGMALVVGMGIVLMAAGDMEVMSRNLGEAWSLAYQGVAGVFVALAVAQYALLVPLRETETLAERKKAYRAFWQEDGHWSIVLVLLVFPMHEWMAMRGASLFMVDVGSIGGLSLGPQEVALVQGTVGGLALMTGALAGLRWLRRTDSSALFWPMALAVTLPDAIYVYLAYTMTSNLLVICLCVGVEQFLLGWGMPVYLIYIYHYCKGRNMKARADICIALVTLSLVVSGVLTGWLQDAMGYRRFFAMVTLLAVLTLLLPVRKSST